MFNSNIYVCLVAQPTTCEVSARQRIRSHLEHIERFEGIRASYTAVYSNIVTEECLFKLFEDGIHNVLSKLTVFDRNSVSC